MCFLSGRPRPDSAWVGLFVHARAVVIPLRFARGSAQCPLGSRSGIDGNQLVWTAYLREQTPKANTVVCDSRSRREYPTSRFHGDCFGDL